MKTEEIKTLFEQFENAASTVENIECWSARVLSAGWSQCRRSLS